MADAAVAVIGGGVVGLAIAAELSAHLGPLYLFERHGRYGQETSSRNSEVIHAGIYYPHNSLKTELCIEGRNLLYQLCEENDIPHRRITKIITAISQSELPALENLYHHGLANGVTLELLTAAQVHALEPNITSAGGILSPSTGIISAHGLMDCFYHTARENGAEVLTRCEVVGLEKVNGGYVVTVRENSSQLTSISTEWVINAAGLESDTIASLAGINVDEAGYRVHWAKGSYFAVQGEKRKVVSRLVYPLPPRESLGVHAVVDLGGGLKFGPDVEYLSQRALDYAVDPSKRAIFGESVRRIVPSLKDDDLEPDMSGIRAKLQAKGEQPKDFIIRHEKDRGLPGLVNLIGIDSPGLTASPAIAKFVLKIVRG